MIIKIHEGELMDSFEKESHSIWQDRDKAFSPPLACDLTTDICIVGAGISGLTTAYLLLKEGKEVVVIDRERIGFNQTGLTSAHLSNALDEGFVDLKKRHGVEGMKKAAESHTQAIDQIESIIREESIECDFERVDGYLFLGPDQSPDDLHEELETAHLAGLTQVELLPNAPFDLFNTGPCLQYPRQAQFHPLKYILGLTSAIQRLGGQIFSSTTAQDVKGGYPAKVTTTHGFQINCDAVVVATNVPINNRLILQTKIAAYRSYVIGLKVPRGTLPQALLWDTEDPYHYVRVVKDPDSTDDILLVGGEDHRTGQEPKPQERFEKLLQWAQERLHVEPRVAFHWSGQIIEPMDGLAFIGRNPGDEENIFIVTGDSGHGLTHGTIAGLLLRDLILERENPWTTLYSPARINLRGLNTFIKETVHSTSPYSDWVKPGDVSSLEEIKPHEGAVIREGLKKVAAYRDHSGALHKFSAVCPHLGGIVRWNSSEKTWDCPCHGSRFDKMGEVLNGPAANGLTKVEDPFAEENLPSPV